MKIVTWIYILLCSTCFLFPFPLHAEDQYFNSEEEINSALVLGGWMSQADAKWQISFPYVTNTGQPGTIQSRLDFKKINSPIIIFAAGGKVKGEYSFDLLYGTGTISGGHGIDTDRFLPDSGGGFDFSQSTNDIRGDVREWGINLYYNNKRYGSAHTGPWGMVLGYLHYQDSLRMTNGLQTLPLNFEGSTQPAGPFPGLNSTYDFTWSMFRIGALYQPQLTETLSLTGTFSIYPYATYEGDGYWNLRAGTNPGNFRVQSPNFIQTASTAYGYDASLGLTYLVSENLELTAGYRYFYLYARNGTDTTYFANGTEYRDKLDWVTVTRQGAYAAAVLKF
jgi:Protochlamydia outer membrane protein